MGKWQDKIVVVTGGSAGLGLAIAREFGRRGARPVLVSRNEQNLKAAADELGKDSIVADSLVADVLSDSQVQSAVDEIVRRYQRIDVLVNCVGRSTRVPVTEAAAEDYRELMEINFLSAVNCTRACMPALQQARGHVVNIGSLASKTAWPFLAPYTASKFALSGFTKQLQVEGPRQVHFMLVCPGPIQREDAGYRYDRASDQLPERALQPGAGAKVEGLLAADVARKIVRGCEKRKLELVMPWRARILFVISAISPRLANWILRRLSK
jgi:short-subunit dehydrogenase